MVNQNIFIDSFFVARQPVFDRERNIWGYELLFRNSAVAGKAQIDNEDAATSQVIADGFGLIQEDLAKGQKILINFPRNMLLEKASDLLPPEVCVVEILETVQPEPEIIEILESVRDDGFELALDDFIGQEGFEPLIELADIVKVDCLDVPRENLENVVRSLRDAGVKVLLAEKVEDLEALNLCLDLGFDLFQGFFFSKPEILPGEKLSSGQLSRFELLSAISSPEFEVEELTDAINADVSLSYRLLKFINSAAFGISNKVNSIKQAIALLGHRKLAGWLRVILLSDMSSTPTGNELTFLSIKRAKFFELLAKDMDNPPHPPETMFMLGLLSLLDALLGKPMKELLDKLPIEKELALALCKGSGSLGEWLVLAESFEKGNWNKVASIIKQQEFNSDNVARNNHAARQWAHEVTSLSSTD